MFGESGIEKKAPKGEKFMWQDKKQVWSLATGATLHPQPELVLKFGAKICTV